MKLIINISEEEYKEVLEDTYSGTPFENKIFTIIARGVPYEERQKGEWEYQYRFCDEKLYKCTHCGRLLSIHNVQDISEFHFCQECGADMREEENGQSDCSSDRSDT